MKSIKKLLWVRHAPLLNRAYQPSESNDFQGAESNNPVVWVRLYDVLSQMDALIIWAIFAIFHAQLERNNGVLFKDVWDTARTDKYPQNWLFVCNDASYILVRVSVYENGLFCNSINPNLSGSCPSHNRFTLIFWLRWLHYVCIGLYTYTYNIYIYIHTYVISSIISYVMPHVHGNRYACSRAHRSGIWRMIASMQPWMRPWLQGAGLWWRKQWDWTINQSIIEGEKTMFRVKPDWRQNTYLFCNV